MKQFVALQVEKVTYVDGHERSHANQLCVRSGWESLGGGDPTELLVSANLGSARLTCSRQGHQVLYSAASNSRAVR